MEDKKDIEIAYQNKDITMKSFADRLKGKTLAVVGLKDIKIQDVLPTNLPAIEANELRLDNLFKLATGEYAIVDYESEYSEANKVKYIGYIARVSKRLYNEYGEFKPLKLIVIYTADVQPDMTDPMISMGDVSVCITEAFLIELGSNEIRDSLNAKIKRGYPFDVEDMMRLALYPLTYKGNEAKQKAVTEAIDIAEGIADERMILDALKWIFVFADKVITEDDAKRIRRHMMGMTKIERILEEEKEEAIKVIEEGRVKAEEGRVRAEESRVKAEESRVKAEEDKVRAEQERDEIEREAARLRELLIANGINPAAAV